MSEKPILFSGAMVRAILALSSRSSKEAEMHYSMPPRFTGPGTCQIEELPEPLLNLIRDIQNQNQHNQ